MKPYDLTVVMPVYNEAEAIGPVLEKWTKMLDSLNIRYRICAYNDGSRDATGEILQRLTDGSNGRICGITKANSGHGPTILQGYRAAAKDSDWVFQIDSDDEMGPESFPSLWEKRDSYDFLVGYRQGRKQPLPRKLISFVSRLCVRLFYSKGIWDVNTPYRLMRAEKFESFYQAIPPNTFAPNVIISGLAANAHLRTYEQPVPQHDRTTGEVSIKKWKLLKAATRSFAQTIGFAVSLSQEPEKAKTVDIFSRGVVFLGLLFSLFLCLYPSRLIGGLVVLPMFLICYAKLKTSQGRSILNYIVRHQLASFLIILLIGFVLRLGVSFFYPSVFSQECANPDYIILWEKIQAFASGSWPISKSWSTVVYYGTIAKLAGVSLNIAFVGTLLLYAISISCLYLLVRRWFGVIGALFAVFSFAISPQLVLSTLNIATEHTYGSFVLLALFLLSLSVDAKTMIRRVLLAAGLGVCIWLATWSRGEGFLLLFVALIVYLVLCVRRQLSGFSAIQLFLPLILVMMIGAKFAIYVNRRTSDANTIFCSNDNLWPRLFGSNVKTYGTWSAEDKQIIWTRYLSANPAIKSTGSRYGVPVELSAQCPSEIVPYVKSEIRNRWRSMTIPEIIKLTIFKEAIDWSTPRQFSFPNHSYLFNLLVNLPFEIVQIVIIILGLLYYLFMRSRNVSIVSSSVLIFVIGNACLLVLTEASPRYGWLLYLLWGVYAGGFVNFALSPLLVKKSN